MSGGSFDYACHDVWDLDKALSLASKLMSMRGRILTKYPDAIPYLNEMIEFINQIAAQYDERGRRIYDLLHAIEWHYSGDSGEEGITDALEKLKAEHPLPIYPSELNSPLIKDIMGRLEALERKVNE